jgi:predicted CoA-binding protein
MERSKENSGLTVIVGASPQKDRYAYLAFLNLKDQGRPFALVNPRYTEIDGSPVVPSLAQVPGPVGTLSLYLAPGRQDAVADDVVAARPGRVIFNPGSENPALKARLEAEGIPCVDACTLVLLRTGQF